MRSFTEGYYEIVDRFQLFREQSWKYWKFQCHWYSARYCETVSKQKEAIYEILKQKIKSNFSQKHEEYIFTNFRGDVHYEVTHQILSNKLCFCVTYLNI
jgi:hypothetical protein